MCAQEFVQLCGPPLSLGLPPSSARGASRSLAGSSPIPASRPSLEKGAGARVLDQAASRAGRISGLTSRDLELLGHLADGRSTGQIAAAMSVTGNTTRTRIRRVQRKLVVARREHVVAAARQLGVV
jgi:DNA-binding CsgD family transcriptional regulator